ncbi:MAG: hydrolase [Gammaproteobacteria bacterium]|nr:hydrolase [Gammaproteobacteria bacterium]
MSKKQFKPAWWLPNSHLQTIWPVFCRRIIPLPLKRERLELPDGDFVDLDWLVNKAPCEKLVIILHGLEGSVDSHYARGMLRSLALRGWHAVFMHFRGCSGEPNRFPKDYHSGHTSDVSYVVDLIKSRYPNAKLGAVGYSLGGNVLLKWLGETKEKSPLQVATAISVPFELHKAAARLQKGFSRFYQWYFIKCLRFRLEEKFKNLAAPLDLSVFNQVKTMAEFDDKVTAPLHGFTGVDDYYNASSSRQFLNHITVPTLIIHAKDDPFMSEDVIPQQDDLPANIFLEITERGGHVGFVGGRYPWRPDYWLESRVPHFLNDYL